MTKPQIQTVETEASVDSFIDRVEHPGRREDARSLVALMTRVTGEPPRMWGPAIIGFGRYHYRYDSGREGEMPRVAFSPRKANLALYLTAKGDDYGALLARLGKHKSSVACLYVTRLADVDLTVLEELVQRAWTRSHETHRDG